MGDKVTFMMASQESAIIDPSLGFLGRFCAVRSSLCKTSTATARVILSLPNFRACTKARAVGEARSRAVSAQDDALRYRPLVSLRRNYYKTKVYWT